MNSEYDRLLQIVEAARKAGLPGLAGAVGIAAAGYRNYGPDHRSEWRTHARNLFKYKIRNVEGERASERTAFWQQALEALDV